MHNDRRGSLARRFGLARRGQPIRRPGPAWGRGSEVSAGAGDTAG